MTDAAAVRWPARLRTALGWVLFAGVLVLVWPSSLGGCTTLVAVTGHSMEPTLWPGDLAIARCGSPVVGDAVVYRPFDDRSALVIHRIIGGDPESGWTLQGDNNDFVDPFKPTADHVLGVMVGGLPRVGGMARSLSNPWIWGSALVLAAGLLLGVSAGHEPQRALEAEDSSTDVVEEPLTDETEQSFAVESGGSAHAPGPGFHPDEPEAAAGPLGSDAVEEHTSQQLETV